MQLGKIVYGYDMKSLFENKKDAIVNFGDNVQTFGVEVLYEMMGYSKDDIRKINLYNFHNYSSEDTIVPMSGFFSSGLKYKVIPATNSIHPLFIGFHSHDESILDNIDYLKKYQPIGCRDEYTKDMLCERGIEAYISGCASIMLPTREKQPEKNKTFFVDIPIQLEEYIPSELKKNCEYISHIMHVNTLDYNKEQVEKNDKRARELIDRYKNEATLVVTSKLHCAAPCVAMGIPVILVRENIDYRFGWIDKFIHIYDIDEFSNINWKPEPVKLENVKKLFYSIFSYRVKHYGQNIDSQVDKSIKELNNFYSNRNKSAYNKSILYKINKMISLRNTSSIDCLIWGAGRTGTILCNIINKNFPNINIISIIDTYKTGTLKGIPIIKPYEIKNYPNNYIFIATIPGKRIAEDMLKRMGKKDSRDYTFITMI